MMQRLVFFTDSKIRRSSSGRRVRGSRTSNSTPSFANSSAAANATCSILDHATTVTSVPLRLISAWPSGMGRSPSDIGPLRPYSTSPSMKMTGLSSRMAVLSSALASAGVDGATTFRPGT